MEFRSKVNRADVDITGDPKMGRDFGFTKIQRYEPNVQDFYVSVREPFTVVWKCSIEQKSNGISGIDIAVDRVYGDYVLEMWSDDPDFEGEAELELDAAEDTGWYIKVEIDNNRSEFSVYPLALDINLNSREIKVTF